MTKPSGAEGRRRRAAALRRGHRPKSGRPKGSTKAPGLTSYLKRDLAWIGEPDWSSARLIYALRAGVVERPSSGGTFRIWPSRRSSPDFYRKWDIPPDIAATDFYKKFYKRISDRTLRRHIADVQRGIFLAKR
jgi:hypothetical protein